MPAVQTPTLYFDSGRAVAYRVACPTCGEWAQLRVTHHAERHRVTGFSCRNQTSAAHPQPLSAQLRALVPASAA